MAWSAFDIQRIALELASVYQSKTIINAFSSSSEELFLEFSDAEPLKIQFYKGEFLLTLLDSAYLPKRNRLPIFKPLIHLEITEIKAYTMDRIFYMQFKNELKLYFFLFGRFAQIALYKGDSLMEHFPKARKPINQIPLEKKFEIPASIDDVRIAFPWIPQHEIEILEKQFLQKEGLDWSAYFKAKLKEPVFLCKANSAYVLGNTKVNEPIHRYDVFIEALSDYSSLHIAYDSFNTKKSQLLDENRILINQLQTKIENANRSLIKQESNQSYKDKADLLMAHVHLNANGVSEIVLPSFDGLTQVHVKLKKELSLQKNAERYYKKAKKEQLSIQHLHLYIQKLTEELTHARQERASIEQTTGIKELNKYITSKVEAETDSKLPYKRLSIMGFEIRIGKSASDNDSLLRLHSRPHDLWFHAKGVSGSHVILRLEKNFTPSHELIEKVAAVAAYHSKAKTEALARVIYTYRKFVRKPKKANPGAVIVDKETSVLVAPSKN